MLRCQFSHSGVVVVDLHSYSFPRLLHVINSALKLSLTLQISSTSRKPLISKQLENFTELFSKTLLSASRPLFRIRFVSSCPRWLCEIETFVLSVCPLAPRHIASVTPNGQSVHGAITSAKKSTVHVFRSGVLI